MHIRHRTLTCRGLTAAALIVAVHLSVGFAAYSLEGNAVRLSALPKAGVQRLADLRKSVADRRNKRLQARSDGTHFAAPSWGQNTAPFPQFTAALFPVRSIPDWGNMRTPAEWNRTYEQMTADDFVGVPRYDIAELTIPLQTLTDRSDPRTVSLLTSKLFYSTRFFGAYHLDSGQYAFSHAGMDFKLPPGMPVDAIARGRVNAVLGSKRLGRHVIIEHRHPTDGTFYSVYGHLDDIYVAEGQDVYAGAAIGTVGLTGQTTSAHLHLQIDRGSPGELTHVPYHPEEVPAPDEADRYTVHPIAFFEKYRSELAGGETSVVSW